MSRTLSQLPLWSLTLAVPSSSQQATSMLGLCRLNFSKHSWEDYLLHVIANGTTIPGCFTMCRASWCKLRTWRSNWRRIWATAPPKPELRVSSGERRQDQLILVTIIPQGMPRRSCRLSLARHNYCAHNWKRTKLKIMEPHHNGWTPCRNVTFSPCKMVFVC